MTKWKFISPRNSKSIGFWILWRYKEWRGTMENLLSK